MDVSNYLGIAGVTVAVLSAAFSYFNRERYKTLIRDIYQPGNDELRSQLSNVRQEKVDTEKEATEWRTKYEEQQKYVDKLEKLNLRLPDFAGLTKLISNNHTEVMKGLSEITKKALDKS